MAEEAVNKDFRPINIKELFRDKNPRMAALLPGFIYRYLHRTLQIDFINEILRNHGHKKDFEFASASIDMFNVSVEVKGEENIPGEGRYIFVSNHPLGGFDGVLYIRELGKFYDDLKFLVNDILMNIKNMDGIFVPINKHGAQALENVRRIDEIFRSSSQVVTFPAGLVSRRHRGKIEDPVWHKSFITKAIQHERDVVPMHITGRCTNFFYTIANLRKFLRIRSNLEMFYLPRETFKHRNGHYTMTIGKPISYKTFDRSLRPPEWAEQVKRHCYSLPENPNREFIKQSL